MIRHLTTAIIRTLTGLRVHYLASTPPPAQALYYANHSSHLDALVIWSALPEQLRRQIRPVAAEDYWSAKPWRRWVAERLINAVLIPRSNITRDNHPLDRMDAALAAKSSLIVFPEGGRGDGDDIGQFKPGIAHLTERHPDLPCVPVLLRNMNRILPKGEWLPVPMMGSVVIGPAVQRQPDEDRSQFLQRCRDAILALEQHVHVG